MSITYLLIFMKGRGAHTLATRHHCMHIYHLQVHLVCQVKIIDWIGLSSVVRPRQHRIGYMGDGFYRSKDPTNSIKVLKEQIVHRQIKHTISSHEHKTQQVP